MTWAQTLVTWAQMLMTWGRRRVCGGRVGPCIRCWCGNWRPSSPPTRPPLSCGRPWRHLAARHTGRVGGGGGERRRGVKMYSMMGNSNAIVVCVCVSVCVGWWWWWLCVCVCVCASARACVANMLICLVSFYLLLIYLCIHCYNRFLYIICLSITNVIFFSFFSFF